MTLKILLENKKFDFEIDGEGQFYVKFFKNSFILIDNTYQEDQELEYWITIDYNKDSKVSKQTIKKAFINFVKLLKENNIKYVFDENLNLN